LNRIKTGQFGEDIACEHLEKNSIKIIKRNARFGKLGEIDIIAQENDEIIFIEVKTKRTGSQFGSPSEAVNHNKQNKIKKMADVYLNAFAEERYLRFDIIEVIYDKYKDKIKTREINHIKNAFE
jgi:putative endonuclease